MLNILLKNTKKNMFSDFIDIKEEGSMINIKINAK